MLVFGSRSSSTFAPAAAVPRIPVLWREQGDELQLRMLRDQIDVRSARAVDPALVGDEAYALASERRRDVGEEDLDAGSDQGRILSGQAEREGHEEEGGQGAHIQECRASRSSRWRRTSGHSEARML